MPFRPLIDPAGRLIIRGAVVGSHVLDAEDAIILILKLEQFETLLPLFDPPPEWEPLMRGKDDPYTPEKAAAPQEPRTSEPSVQMLQIAIPLKEALKLGWSLLEAARQALAPPASNSRPPN